MIATSDAAQTATRIREMGNAVIALADTLAHAQQVQYDAPPAALAVENDRTAPTGRISDPTADITADPRRLAVRAAVISGELAAEEIAAKATAAAAELSAAVKTWAGLRA